MVTVRRASTRLKFAADGVRLRCGICGDVLATYQRRTVLLAEGYLWRGQNTPRERFVMSDRGKKNIRRAKAIRDGLLPATAVEREQARAALDSGTAGGFEGFATWQRGEDRRDPESRLKSRVPLPDGSEYPPVECSGCDALNAAPQPR